MGRHVAFEAGGKEQIILFDQSPSAAAIETVDRLATPEDQLVWGDRVLRWLPRVGILDSMLDMRAIERVLVKPTTRARNTIERIAKKFC